MSEGLPRYPSPLFFGVADQARFNEGLNTALSSLSPFWAQGLFTGDNLITFSKNLSFLTDRPFMDAVARHATTNIERGIIWRTAVLVWAARNGLRREGDFVECGCYRGVSARIVCDAVAFNTRDRDFYLYDLFDYPDGSTHSRMPGMSPDLYQEVVERFADVPRARVIRGAVPDSFAQGVPERISFLHIDMNSAPPEIAALEYLFDRVSPGGVIVLDDYGYIPYRAQRDAERPWFAERGYDVIELPTSQGLVIK